jgi:hypothetical protein
MHFKIKDINVAISQETVDAYEVHKAFCSVGQKLLLRYDADGSKEKELIEKVSEYFYQDFLDSISNFDEELYDEYEEIFFDLDVQDYWFELQDLIESAQLSA